MAYPFAELLEGSRFRFVTPYHGNDHVLEQLFASVTWVKVNRTECRQEIAVSGLRSLVSIPPSMACQVLVEKVGDAVRIDCEDQT